jgi:arylsulfatase A-like enzyme
MVEGAGLLVFQRINWAQWGRTMHVSVPILWISPAADVTFFVLIALTIYVAAVLVRIPSLRVLCALLTFLSVYDWLRLTNRLYPFACLLFALACAVVMWQRTRFEESGLFLRMWKVPAVSVLIVLCLIQMVPRWRERQKRSQLPKAAAGAPNVLVIVLDTLRADHVSSYGYSRTTTPTIDAMARQGVLFENAIAATSWSLPSHASLLTGRYPREHGLQNIQPEPWLGWGHSAMNGYPTLGEAMQALGYRTGAFSANRVYFTENVGLGRGFLHFEDYFYSVGDSLVRTVYGRIIWQRFFNRSEKSAFTRGLRYLKLDSWLDKDSEGSGDYGGAYGVRKRAEEVNRELLAWIGHDRQHPFFVFLNYLDVHYAYGGPRQYQKPPWDKGTVIDEYDAGLKYDDDSIAELWSALQRRGFTNTLIIITSDHGESLGDHGLGYHGASLYRELIRVPLIIYLPGVVPGGVRVQQPISTNLLARTILELTGPPDERFPGPALAHLWASNTNPFTFKNPLSDLVRTDVIVPRDRIMQGKIPIAADGDMNSVYSSRWHLIHHQKDGDQLYEVERDAAESNDMAKSDGTAEVIRDLLGSTVPPAAVR